jgi:putative DNA primase/helicase
VTITANTTEGQGPIAEAAQIWADAGCSVVPIRADGTKKPAVEWKDHQAVAADTDQLRAWFLRRPAPGIGLVCGKVSGNLEMTELEGRAFTAETIQAIGQRCDDLHVGDVFALLLSDDFGYTETTPSGGIHLLYRITDHDVPGNTKLARRPATAEELADKPLDKVKVLAETRGEGGYVIVAPTGGPVHPTGQPWEVLAGRLGQIPAITWEQRHWIHQAIRDVLDQMPPEVAPERLVVAGPPRTAGSPLRPGDDFNERANWPDILQPEGWTFSHRQGETLYWTRPGKDRREGHSATTGHAGRGANDRLYVMSSATDLPTEEPLSKFYVYTHYNHRGSFTDATRELSRRGYGQQRSDTFHSSSQPKELSTLDSPKTEPLPSLSRTPRGRQDYTISGAANRFVQEQGHFFWYVTEEKTWRMWNGVAWQRDELGAGVSLAFEAMTEDMMDEADRLLAQAVEDPDKLPMAKAFNKHVNAIRNANRSNLLALVANQRLISAAKFDADPRYLNLRNGVYDLVDDVFLDHHPKFLLTKVADVEYDELAQAPRTEAFFEELLPSQPMREFVYQALGYSMTGEADRKAMMVLQGQSNSGKTQLTELMQGLLGDYAVPVSPGTFTQKRDNGPNPELHDMRGARFVYTSETSHDIALDEELVKRVTGKDTMTTRTLYEKPQRWIPQCVVWIATNNLPRFGSDAEAMWRRVKTIRFVNEFTDDGSSGHLAQPNIGRSLARDEASGLFNLLLAALRRYRNAGRLVEPQELKESVAEHRQETDPVSQWVSVVQGRGQLVATPGARVSQAVIRRAYTLWCQDEGFQALAAQRFGIALGQVLKYAKQRSNGETWILGWQWSGPNWLNGHAANDWRQAHAVDS